MNEETNPVAGEPVILTAANNNGVPMSPLQPEAVQKLLDNMPGFTGGLDWALRDKCGVPLPFVLLVFTGNGVVHTQNFDPKEASRLIRAFAGGLEASDPQGDDHATAG